MHPPQRYNSASRHASGAQRAESEVSRVGVGVEQHSIGATAESSSEGVQKLHKPGYFVAKGERTFWCRTQCSKRTLNKLKEPSLHTSFPVEESYPSLYLLSTLTDSIRSSYQEPLPLVQCDPRDFQDMCYVLIGISDGQPDTA